MAVTLVCCPFQLPAMPFTSMLSSDQSEQCDDHDNHGYDCDDRDNLNNDGDHEHDEEQGGLEDPD